MISLMTIKRSINISMNIKSLKLNLFSKLCILKISVLPKIYNSNLCLKNAGYGNLSQMTKTKYFNPRINKRCDISLYSKKFPQLRWCMFVRIRVRLRFRKCLLEKQSQLETAKLFHTHNLQIYGIRRVRKRDLMPHHM